MLAVEPVDIKARLKWSTMEFAASYDAHVVIVMTTRPGVYASNPACVALATRLGPCLLPPGVLRCASQPARGVDCRRISLPAFNFRWVPCTWSIVWLLAHPCVLLMTCLTRVYSSSP